MLAHIEASLESLLDNACRMSEKTEKAATENLIKGNTDKVMLLATSRQLSSIINQIKINQDGRPQKAIGQNDLNDYPDW